MHIVNVAEIKHISAGKQYDRLYYKNIVEDQIDDIKYKSYDKKQRCFNPGPMC